MAVKTPIGMLPTPEALELNGLNLSGDDLRQLLAVDIEGWKKEAEDVSNFYRKFGDRLPPALESELTQLGTRLSGATIRSMADASSAR